jgi:RHS repeat-associated protein
MRCTMQVCKVVSRIDRRQGFGHALEPVGDGDEDIGLTGPGIDEYLARSDDSTTRYFLPDHLGSTLALTDPAGTITTRYTYSPFGGTSTTGEASSNPFQYTGREKDSTGLYYYRARYYDPKIQRFISSDPIGLDGGLNTYAYVENNPIAFIDPYGLRYRTQPRNLPPQNSRTGGSNYKGDWYPNLGTTEPRPGSPFRTPSDRVVRDRPEMPPLRDEDLHKALEELPDFNEKALKDLLDMVKDRDVELTSILVYDTPNASHRDQAARFC